MSYLWSVDIGMRPARALHLLDELAGLQVVELSRFEVIIRSFRLHGMIHGACESLNPNVPMPPHLINVGLIAKLGSWRTRLTAAG